MFPALELKMFGQVPISYLNTFAVIGILSTLAVVVYFGKKTVRDAITQKKLIEFISLVFAGVAIIISLWPSNSEDKKIVEQGKRILELEARIKNIELMNSINNTINSVTQELFPKEKLGRKTSTAVPSTKSRECYSSNGCKGDFKDLP